MPNYEGNPHIAQHGRNTRFTSNNQPIRRKKNYARPWQIMMALRRIGSFGVGDFDFHPFDLEKIPSEQVLTENIVKCCFKHPTVVEWVVARRCARSLLGSRPDMNWVELMLDGPMPDKPEWDDEDPLTALILGK